MDDREWQQEISQKHPPLSQGLSLVELLITISILSLLISLAAPGFRDAVVRQRISSQTQQLYTSLILARSEAIKRGVPVTLCPRVAGSQVCLTNFDRWESGWLLFLDGNDDDVVDAGEEIIRFYDQADGLQVEFNQVAPLTYNAKGFLDDSVGTFIFTICDPQLTTSQPRAIIISNNGRPRVSKTDQGGNPLVCTPPPPPP